MVLRIVALVALLAAASLALSAQEEQRIDGLFQEFKQKFGRKYKDAAEEAYRRGVFAESMAQAAEAAARNPLASFGVTRFSDMTRKEFSAFCGDETEPEFMLNMPEPKVLYTPSQIKRRASIDWRKRGAVTPVVDQGECGSFWSFSAVGNIEGQWAIAGHRLTRLSIQQLVSCEYYDSGCNGGLVPRAVSWLLKKNKGWIATEEDYPYRSGRTQRQHSCKTEINERTTQGRGARISDYIRLPRDEDQMGQWMLEHGPLAVSVDATYLQPYKGGLITDCGETKSTNHAVLAVGFDDRHEPPYWIVKNTWGDWWGSNGYFYVRKGRNVCLIAYRPSSVVI